MSDENCAVNNCGPALRGYKICKSHSDEWHNRVDTNSDFDQWVASKNAEALPEIGSSWVHSGKGDTVPRSDGAYAVMRATWSDVMLKQEGVQDPWFFTQTDWPGEWKPALGIVGLGADAKVPPGSAKSMAEFAKLDLRAIHSDEANGRLAAEDERLAKTLLGEAKLPSAPIGIAPNGETILDAAMKFCAVFKSIDVTGDGRGEVTVDVVGILPRLADALYDFLKASYIPSHIRLVVRSTAESGEVYIVTPGITLAFTGGAPKAKADPRAAALSEICRRKSSFGGQAQLAGMGIPIETWILSGIDIHPRDAEALGIGTLQASGYYFDACRGSVGCWVAPIRGRDLDVFGAQHGVYRTPLRAIAAGFGAAAEAMGTKAGRRALAVQAVEKAVREAPADLNKTALLAFLSGGMEYRDPAIGYGDTSWIQSAMYGLRNKRDPEWCCYQACLTALSAPRLGRPSRAWWDRPSERVGATLTAKVPGGWRA